MNEEFIDNVYIDYSGWAKLSQDTRMQYCGTDKKREDEFPIITVKEWFNLPEDIRGDYILENIVDAIAKSIDGEWTEISLQRGVDNVYEANDT